MKALARSSYRLLITLHPEWFRAEFGKEMLWIFDEQVQTGSEGTAEVRIYTRLLLDALRSIFVQRALRDPQQQSSELQFQSGSSGHLMRIAEGGFIFASCLFNLLSIVGVLAALLFSC